MSALSISYILYLGFFIARVLAVLEALDRHCFDRVDQNNNLDTLYKEVFANCTPPSKDAVDTKDQVSFIFLTLYDYRFLFMELFAISVINNNCMAKSLQANPPPGVSAL